MRSLRHFDSLKTLRAQFIFGAEASISTRAEISHAIGTKFQTLSRAKIRHVIRPLNQNGDNMEKDSAWAENSISVCKNPP